jgi:hypothetical protein
MFSICLICLIGLFESYSGYFSPRLLTAVRRLSNLDKLIFWYTLSIDQSNKRNKFLRMG